MEITYPCGCVRKIEGDNLEARAARLLRAGCDIHRVERPLTDEMQEHLIGVFGSLDQAKEWAKEQGFTIREAASESGYESPTGTAARRALEAACEPYTVNGVYYSNLDEAARVRKALADAGIPHEYPGTRRAGAALRAAGIGPSPKVGEWWAEKKAEEPMRPGKVAEITDDEMVLVFDDGSSERIRIDYCRRMNKDDRRAVKRSR